MNNYIGGGYSDVQITVGDQTYTGIKTFSDGIIVGDPGSEATGINIAGVTYESTFKVSDINGSNYAQTILHRHSTTLQPVIVGARSNSNTSAHTNVATGMGLFSLYGVGYAGSNYKIFSALEFASAAGTVSNTSAPGQIIFYTTPDGSTTLTPAATINSDQTATFVGAITAPTFIGALTGNASTATTSTNVAGGLLGSLPYQSAVNATALLAGNTTTTKKVIKQTGNGSVSAAPILEQASIAECSDYAASTFTPVLTNSVPGDLSVAYTTQLGTYIRIGSQVTIQFSILTSSFTHTTATGDWQITGLPFTSASNGCASTGALEFQNITKAGYTNFAALLDSATNYLLIAGGGSAVAKSVVSGVELVTAGTVLLAGSLTYFI